MDKNRQILIDNMNRLLKQKGKLRMDMANDLGLTSSTVFNWFSGVSYPKIKNLEQIAEYFGVSITQLVGEGKQSTNYTTINVFSRIANGVALSSMDYVVGSEEISSRLAKNGSYFALKVKGDAMSPIINNGDVVIVLEQRTAEHGNVVVVSIGNDDAIIRKIIHTEFGITLIASNTDIEPLFFTDKEIQAIPVKIYGKVVESRRKF